MSEVPSEAVRAVWNAGDLHDLVAAHRRGDLTPQQVTAAEQQRLAPAGEALGQCGSCGAYRLDGQPPLLHHDGCPETSPLSPFRQ